MGAIGLSAALQAAETVRRPHIGYVYPAGVRRGATVTMKVGGENIYGATAAIVSGLDVAVRVVDAQAPPETKDGAGKKFRKKNETVIDEVITLEIAVTPQAAPGRRDLRLIAPGGVSDRLLFDIGEVPEVLEKEPNDRETNAVPLPSPPVLINGQIMSGDTDRFSFSARKGQRLVITTHARALMPYLADAVPGWFQAVLSLSDAQGREVAFADDYRFSPDPVLRYDVPADGPYRLAIRDAIYRGRADFVYRIRIAEQPFVTSVFPLGAPRGTQPVTVALSGWNLPAATATISVNREAAETVPIVVTANGMSSEPVPFAVDDLPEIAEDEAAARQSVGQSVMPPVIVNGRIRAPGESDTYRFAGQKGQRVWIAVHARRLGSPLDSRVTLATASGAKVGENDDVKDRSAGWLTHQADSELLCALPADGSYTVTLSDTQSKGGDDYAYRLRIGPPDPDFALRATPASQSTAAGGSLPFTIHALRRCGFTNAINLALDPASAPGCTLDGGLVPAGTNKVRVTLSVPATGAARTLFPRLCGTAPIGGQTVSRPVVPAEDLMQAFIYQHLVPADDCVVTVTNPPVPFRVLAELGPQGCLELPLGKETAFTVKATRRTGFNGPITLRFDDPPSGITLRRANIPPDRDSALITVRTEKDVEPGLRGNLIAIGTMTIDRDGGTGVVQLAAEPRPSIAGTTNTVGRFGPPKDRISVIFPALPFRVVGRPEGTKSDAGSVGKK